MLHVECLSVWPRVVLARFCGSDTVTTSKGTKPLENTGATEWTNYEQRRYYIAELFRLYTFDPNVESLNQQLSKDRSGSNGALAFVPDNVKARLNSNDASLKIGKK